MFRRLREWLAALVAPKPLPQGAPLPRELALIALESIVVDERDAREAERPEDVERDGAIWEHHLPVLYLARGVFDSLLEITRVECGFALSPEGQIAVMDWSLVNRDEVDRYFLRQKLRKSEDEDAQRWMDAHARQHEEWELRRKTREELDPPIPNNVPVPDNVVELKRGA